VNRFISNLKDQLGIIVVVVSVTVFAVGATLGNKKDIEHNTESIKKAEKISANVRDNTISVQVIKTKIVQIKDDMGEMKTDIKEIKRLLRDK
jgi:TctA family transporter